MPSRPIGTYVSPHKHTTFSSSSSSMSLVQSIVLYLSIQSIWFPHQMPWLLLGVRIIAKQLSFFLQLNSTIFISLAMPLHTCILVDTSRHLLWWGKDIMGLCPSKKISDKNQFYKMKRNIGTATLMHVHWWLIITSNKNHFYKMKRDIEIAEYKKKQVKQVPYPTPIYFVVAARHETCFS